MVLPAQCLFVALTKLVDVVFEAAGYNMSLQYPFGASSSKDAAALWRVFPVHACVFVQITEVYDPSFTPVPVL
jgi:hypothetical protein